MARSSAPPPLAAEVGDGDPRPPRDEYFYEVCLPMLRDDVRYAVAAVNHMKRDWVDIMRRDAGDDWPAVCRELLFIDHAWLDKLLDLADHKPRYGR